MKANWQRKSKCSNVVDISTNSTCISHQRYGPTLRALTLARAISCDIHLQYNTFTSTQYRLSSHLTINQQQYHRTRTSNSHRTQITCLKPTTSPLPSCYHNGHNPTHAPRPKRRKSLLQKMHIPKTPPQHPRILQRRSPNPPSPLRPQYHEDASRTRVPLRRTPATDGHEHRRE